MEIIRKKVLILGGGKIGRALVHYLKKNKAISEIALFSLDANSLKGSSRVKILKGDVFDSERVQVIEKYDFLIGALPEQSGKRGLELALEYGKDLIDVSVVPISFYLKHKKKIEEKGIKVVPGCGVSPGLTNLIAGFGMRNFKKDDEVEIGAGTLSVKKNHFFPFTWSFSDLIEEHLYHATVISRGEKMRLAPFSGYRIQRLDGLGNFESYFVDEWSTLPYSLGLKNLSFRVIRPVGFFNFFQFLKNHSFFKKENITQAEKLLTLEKSDNTTAIYVKIGGKSQKNFFWQASIFSKKNDKLNSMQKITSLMPATVLDFLLKEEIKIKKGIILMEEIGKEKHLFRKIIGILKNEGVEFKRGK